MRILSIIYESVYGVPTLTLIFSVFLFLNIKTRFIGIRKISASIKTVFSKNKNGNFGSALKSACVSLSATVGTGNIVGVAGAVSLGGAGAVFWMWVSAILSLSVKYLEIYLSSIYKKDGSAYSYIFKVLNSNALRRVFLVLGIIAAFGIGNLTQTNAASSSAAVVLREIGIRPDVSGIIVGIVFMLLCVVLLKRESGAVKLCEILLPFMAAAYILFCAAALFVVREKIPDTFSLILKGAFSPKAVTGGMVGSVIKAMKAGVARGIFSNEAGLSTAALAYEKSTTPPHITALFGIFEVIVDTLILCTLTALVVISSGTVVYGKDLGAYTTMSSFTSILGKNSVFWFCPIICFFAFSSVIGWGIYARRFSEKLSVNPNLIVLVYSACCILGAVSGAGAVWQIAEISSILMMTVNCAALILNKYS